MTSKTLKKKEALLLQRHVDDELDDGEADAAAALLERSAAARVYVSALKSLHEAVRVAEKMAWKGASLPPPETWVELAETSSDLAETPLDDLAPMLERFHDGEVDEAEAAVVAALVDERDDVAGYLSELDRLAAGIRKAGVADEVDFDGFWDGIREGIDHIDDEKSTPVAIDPFDPEEHRLLLYRFHDDEVTAEERRRVEAWIEANDEGVDSLLGALAEVHLGVNIGIEIAREQADLDGIWTGVCDELDTIDAEQAADNVVAFDDPPRSASPNPTPVWNKPILAVAAAVILLATGALMGPQLLQQDEEVVETRTVVIFDNIESAPGSSVFLHTPELADHEVEHGLASGRNGQPMIRAEDDYADPTVLWLIDEEEDEEDEDSDEDEDEEDEEPEEETEELPGPI